MFDKLTEWIINILAEIVTVLLDDALGNIENLITWASVNVAETPEDWMGGVGVTTFLQSIVNNVLVPVGGIILSFVIIYEFIQTIIEKNNMHEFDMSIFLRFALKGGLGIYLLANCWDITMAIFELGGYIVDQSGYDAFLTIYHAGTAGEAIRSVIASGDATIAGMITILCYLLFLWLSTIALTVSVYIVSIGRMIEIFMYISCAPVPFATLTNRDWGDIGKNYVKALLSLALQGFFIIICIVIYSAISSNILSVLTVPSNWANPYEIANSILLAAGTGFVLCFTLFKTSTISKSILNAH